MTGGIKYDAAMSISSFDHDGLGRYGDPLCADGDLLAMDHTITLLHPNAILYLTIPVGPDVVVWNLHRRYGTIRLPLLLHGWHMMDCIGWDEERFHRHVNWRQSYEPVWVLATPTSPSLTLHTDAQPSHIEL
jgi:hypothetical protein